MRITHHLDADAIKILRHYSRAHSLALGKAASELLRKGVSAPAATRLVNGFVVFDIPPSGPRISNERVKELLDS